jgi:outer membrane protein TolC
MNKLAYIAMACSMGVAPMMAETLTISSSECVEMALEASREMKQASNSEQQAKLDKEIAHTAYLPNFSGNATAMWRFPDTDMLSMQLQLRGLYLAGISVTQPVFAGGKIVAANKLASIGKVAAAEQTRLTRAQIVSNAENSYWSYVAVRAKQAMMRSYKALIDTVYEQTLASVRAGMSTDNDLLRIDARRSQITYQLAQVDNGANLCRLSLCNLLDLDADTQINTTDTDVAVDIPADLGNYSIADRAEVQLLQAQVDAKNQQVKMTRADFLPQIGVQAGWSAYGNIKIKGYAEGADGNMYPYTYNSSGTGWNVMASVSVPLFHWGEGYKKVKKAKLEVENARLELENRSKQMTLEVSQAISNVDNGQQMLKAAEVAMAQAESNLQAQNQRYNLGLSSLTEQLDAQSQWQTSASNLIEARTQLRLYYVEYQRVTGRL